MRIAAICAGVIWLSGINQAYAGSIFNDWPDVIICKKQLDADMAREYVFIISSAKITTSVTSRCLTGGTIPNTHEATYVPLHWHAEDAHGNLKVVGPITGAMMFCGPTIDEAAASLAPASDDIDDCRIGVKIAELTARGQTRNFFDKR
jgi:hypothetical protein